MPVCRYLARLACAAVCVSALDWWLMAAHPAAPARAPARWARARAIAGSRFCTAAEAEANARRDWAASNCPDQRRWMPAYMRQRASGPAVTLVFVGCNKGYDAVRSMRGFTGDARFSVAALRQFYLQSHILAAHAAQGACGAGTAADAQANGSAPGVPGRAYCIEPMRGNFDALNRSFAHLQYARAVHLTYAAVGSTPGWVRFPSHRPAGTEYLGIDQPNGGPEEDIPLDGVPQVTLDDYAARHAIRHIDWLSVDTEGNDARVLLGAVQLLQGRRIALLEFEAHAVNHWLVSSLQDTVDLLEHLGYTCYWQSNAGNLIQISNCWHNAYRQHTWKNIACVLRSVPLYARMHAIAWEGARGAPRRSRVP
jgi:FkbM family methyltransferase